MAREYVGDRVARKRPIAEVDNEDSSDEEEIGLQNREYDFASALARVDFEKLASALNERPRRITLYTKDGPQVVSVTALQCMKSFLMNNLGRMGIYSPDAEKEYRDLKEKFLPRDDIVLATNSRDVIDTSALGIKVESLKGLLAFGRLIRRSQIRLHSDLDRNGEEIVVKATFASSNQKTKSEVKETVVASMRGLGLPRWPFMDMVDLKLANGDYASAYKGNSVSCGENATEQVADAAEIVAEKKSNPELKEAVRVIRLLVHEIGEEFPEENSDEFIAGLIQKACLGEPLTRIQNNQVIQDKVYALAYLIFKTEVYRSPAALINNMQMVDLISNGKMTFKEAFVDQKMPMSMSGAIKAARELNDTYSKLGGGNDSFYHYRLPYQYATPGEVSDDVITLITKEADMLDSWISHKFGEEKAPDINNNPKQYLPEICKKVDNLMHRFGLEIDSRAWSQAKLGQGRDSGLSSASR